MPKPKVGLFSFTGCEGCFIVLLESMNDKWKKWFKRMEITYAKLLKSKNVLAPMDVALVEGAISTEHEKKHLQKIRKAAKLVVAVGACATTAAPSAMRNAFDAKKTKEIAPSLKKFKYLDKVYPISRFVKVDYKIEGCPVDREKLEEYIESVLNA